MELACPACGKVNELRTTGACSRCGCDLTTLATIVSGAIWHLKAAAGELRMKEWQSALAHAERSWGLRHSLRAAQIAGLAALALGKDDEMLRWQRRQRSQKE